MKLQDSHSIKKVIEVFPCDVGRLFFLEQIVVIEINKGVHLNLKNAQALFFKINNFYGNKKSIGIISNRVNHYSIEVLDYNKLFRFIPNATSFAIVNYHEKHFYTFEIDKKFSNIPFTIYSSLEEALHFTSLLVKIKPLKDPA